jgi:hypothetical protein
MEYNQIHTDYPIWDIKDFILPDINWKESEVFDQLIRSNEYGEFNSPKGLRKNLIHTNNDDYQNFLDAWNGYTVQLEQMLITTDLLIVDQMWKGHIKRLHWPQHDKNTDYLLDLPNFKMGEHLDNRYVLGVLIINIQDNPEGSGTHIKELDHAGTTEKGTGLLILNNYNTYHSVMQPGPGDRKIGYQTLTIDHLYD